MRIRYGSVAGTLLFFAAASLPADGSAQVRDTTEVPDSIAATLPPIVVTASRVPVRADQLGISTSVLTADDLERRAPFTPWDALRNLPGFFLDESVGPGGPTIIRLRGGEEFYTQVRVDGVEINQTGGFLDLRGLNLSNLGRVEVSRGPQSALYGTSAVNGVVHFLTPMGLAGPPRIEGEIEGGAGIEEHNSTRGEVSVSGGSETFRYSLGGGGSWTRGIWEIANDLWTADGVARLDWMPSERWSLTSNIRFLTMESNLPVRDPGVTRAPLDPNARDENDRFITSVEAEFAPSEEWSHLLKVDAFNKDNTFEDEKDGVEQPGDFFIFDFDFSLRSDYWRNGVEWASRYDGRSGRSGLAFSVGARWEREDLHNEQAGEFGDNVRDLERQSGAGFAELHGSLEDRVDVLAGLRLDKFEGIDAELSPRLSAVVHAAPGTLDLRGAVGTSFKAPRLDQQFPDNGFIASNEDLAPESVLSWEVGADVTLAGGRLEASGTFFHQTFEDLIRTVPTEDPDDPRSVNVNLGESEVLGAEWLLRYRPGWSWALGTEGSWIETEIVDNRGLAPQQFPEGEELPFRPSFRGSVFVEILGWQGLSGTLRGTFVGEQIVLTERFSGRREALDGYFLVDLSASYEVSPDVELFGRLENLLDEQYVTAFDRPGIRARGAVGARFTVR